MIVAGPQVAPDPVDLALVAQDMLPVPRMVLVVRAGRCIPHGPVPVALPDPVAVPPLALRALVLVPAPVLVRLAPAWVAQAA